tara:strand:- start:156 stop:314 length:159 start_codon:yes stop_codon:yes gene_type:complete
MLELMLGFAIGILFCQVVDYIKDKSIDKIDKVNQEILVEQLDKVKEELEKSK